MYVCKSKQIMHAYCSTAALHATFKLFKFLHPDWPGPILPFLLQFSYSSGQALRM